MDASAIRAPETGIALTPPEAQSGEPDDLTLIEGIGPKINALLNQNGVYTFAQLAATSVERLRSILELGRTSLPPGRSADVAGAGAVRARRQVGRAPGVSEHSEGRACGLDPAGLAERRDGPK